MVDVGGGEAVRLVTVGQGLQHHVIDIDIAGAGALVGRADGDVAARAGVVVEIDVELVPGARSRVVVFIEALDQGEGGEVVRVGHHAHVEAPIVGRSL